MQFGKRTDPANSATQKLGGALCDISPINTRKPLRLAREADDYVVALDAVEQKRQEFRSEQRRVARCDGNYFC